MRVIKHSKQLHNVTPSDYLTPGLAGTIVNMSAATIAYHMRRLEIPTCRRFGATRYAPIIVRADKLVEWGFHNNLVVRTDLLDDSFKDILLNLGANIENEANIGGRTC